MKSDKILASDANKRLFNVDVSTLCVSIDFEGSIDSTKIFIKELISFPQLIVTLMCVSVLKAVRSRRMNTDYRFDVCLSFDLRHRLAQA